MAWPQQHLEVLQATGALTACLLLKRALRKQIPTRHMVWQLYQQVWRTRTVTGNAALQAQRLQITEGMI